MARGGDMQEVELLDGDEDVAVQPSPPARDRRRLWWVPVGAVAVALSLVGTQLVLDAREDAAAARLAAVPGVFPPLGDELGVLRTISQADATGIWGGLRLGGARTAGILVAPDGSQSFTAIDQRTGDTLWSTPLLGPDADRAASLENAYGGACQGDGTRGAPATVAACLVTDGFVRYEDDGTEERSPATTTRVVVLDTTDGHVITQWEVEETSQLALVGDLAVVGTRSAERGVVVVAHDVITGDEQWRYQEPVDGTLVGSPQEYWGLMAAGDVVAMHDGHGLAFLSPTGTLIREDLRAASRDAGFATDPVTGTFAITSYSSGSARITTLLAPDADPAGDVVLQGEPVHVSVDDGSLPGVVLTYLSHAYAWDRQTGEQLWEAEVQPSYSGLVIRGRVYLTTSTEVLSLDGLSGEVLWRTQLPSYGMGELATDGRDLLLLSSSYDGTSDGAVTVYDLASGDELRTIPYPEGVDDVQLLNGLLVGWSQVSEEITLLE
ncbi:outer membrane protein assembly factor BamB family protein [Cellulomonas humilata]|uniref:Outer membrane protein assembly factor BamB n=1 Tax=Cellulomonas humilata TaxID=144055 RepID=A0ABU0EIK9_9CELL|nr:PQQ-binding-like beta-propeller repeat protein [Cellulomonas humilata]MDQ0375109.1 outer membrane protein assembly factor BamB [Cellulomonas humilata]